MPEWIDASAWLAFAPGDTSENSVSNAQRDYVASRHRHHVTASEGGVDDALAELREEKVDLVCLATAHIW